MPLETVADCLTSALYHFAQVPESPQRQAMRILRIANYNPSQALHLAKREKVDHEIITILEDAEWNME